MFPLSRGNRLNHAFQFKCCLRRIRRRGPWDASDFRATNFPSSPSSTGHSSPTISTAITTKRLGECTQHFMQEQSCSEGIYHTEAT